MRTATVTLSVAAAPKLGPAQAPELELDAEGSSHLLVGSRRWSLGPACQRQHFARGLSRPSANGSTGGLLAGQVPELERCAGTGARPLLHPARCLLAGSPAHSPPVECAGGDSAPLLQGPDTLGERLASCFFGASRVCYAPTLPMVPEGELLACGTLTVLFQGCSRSGSGQCPSNNNSENAHAPHDPSYPLEGFCFVPPDMVCRSW